MRAPEELKFGRYSNEFINRDKADVWCLGDMMYNVLTKRWMFEGIPTKQAMVKIINGSSPPSVQICKYHRSIRASHDEGNSNGLDL